MQIATISLKHFKRFTNLTVNLGTSTAKIVALVGPNGSGKSCVFDAFEEITKNYKNNTAQANPNYFSKNHYSQDEAQNSNQYNRNDAIKITKPDGTVQFNKKSFYIRSSYRFSATLNVDSLRKQPDILEDNKRPHTMSAIDARLQENYERLLNQVWQETKKSKALYKDVFNQYLGKINRILGKILKIKISDLGDIAEGRGQLYFQKGKSKGFPYENLSSGEKEVVDIVIDLIVRTKEFDDTIFCIDEPELHLNTAIQRKLLIEITNLIPPNCQLWVATHSLGFLRALQDQLKEDSIILDFSNNNFDKRAIIKPMRRTRANWERIFKTALEDLAELVAPRKIVYCEGKATPASSGEEAGLDALIYNTIFEQEFHDVLFVSSGGGRVVTQNASLAISVLSKAFSETELLLLRDRDELKEDERATFLAEKTFHRMLKRREIENYLYDFEILKKYYRGLKEEDYNKKITNIKTEDVEKKSKKVMELCNISKNKKKKDFKSALGKLITPDTETYTELKKTIFENTQNRKQRAVKPSSKVTAETKAQTIA
ncbi:MAG: AAA family ATPase [Candidatus Gracilibacteria bacterium]